MNFLSVLYEIVTKFFKNRNASELNITDLNRIVSCPSTRSQMTCYDYYTAFKQFGAIKNIGCLEDESFNNYVIEFYESHSVDAALLRQRITHKFGPIPIWPDLVGIFEISIEPCNRLGYRYCWTEMVENVVNVSNEMQAPSENSSENILSILNDDCLREIFKKLPLSSHSSITNVCVRFNQVAKECFPLKHKNTVFNVDALKTWTLSEADVYFQNFGLSIYKVKCTNEKLEEQTQFKMIGFLGMIIEHCQNVSELRVSNSFTFDILPLYMQLEKLYIDINKIYAVDFSRIFRCCPKLKVLRLKTTDCGQPKLYPVKLPKLVAFSYDIVWYRYSSFNKSLVEFLSQNCQLEMFSYSNENVFREVAAGLISELKCLKVLRLKVLCYDAFIKHLVQELSLKNMPIECLRLELGFVDEDVIENISKMRNIRILEFRNIRYFLKTHELITVNNVNTLREIDNSYKIICLQEKYLVSLLSSLPNLEAIMMRSLNRMDIILTDENIYQMEKELQKKIPSAKLHIHHLINTENTFIDEYFTNSVNRVKATIKKFSGIGRNIHFYWLTIESEYCRFWEFDIFLSPYLSLID